MQSTAVWMQYNFGRAHPQSGRMSRQQRMTAFMLSVATSPLLAHSKADGLVIERLPLASVIARRQANSRIMRRFTARWRQDALEKNITEVRLYDQKRHTRPVCCCRVRKDSKLETHPLLTETVLRLIFLSYTRCGSTQSQQEAKPS